MGKNPFNLKGRSYSIFRQPYDLPKMVNFTTNIGVLMPFDAFIYRSGMSIKYGKDTSVGFRLMPMAYPVQNSLKAQVQFFKVPLRALWRGYLDQYSGDSTQITPYLDLAQIRKVVSDLMTDEEVFRKYLGTGSLLDYLNYPTTYYQPSSKAVFECPFTEPFTLGTYLPHVDYNDETNSYSTICITTPQPSVHNLYVATTPYVKEIGAPGVQTLDVQFVLDFRGLRNRMHYLTDSSSVHLGDWNVGTVKDFMSYIRFRCVDVTSYGPLEATSLSKVEFGVPGDADISIQTMPDGNKREVVSFRVRNEFLAGADPLTTGIDVVFNAESFYRDRAACGNPSGYTLNVMHAMSAALQEFSAVRCTGALLSDSYSASVCPWYDSEKNKDGIITNTMLIRAYNCIYNSWYRNIQNNPFIVDGKPKYNDFIVNRDDGGADTSIAKDHEFLSLRRHNWKEDFLTTCVPDPMQSYDPAHPDRQPLVGLTVYTDGKGLQSTLTTEDGKTYLVDPQHDEKGLTGVSYVEADPSDLSGMKRVTSYNNSVQLEGISIQDFRDVNAFTRFLEQNRRQGYSYKRMVEGRFDCNVRYDELLMAEYCGGVSLRIEINPVTQTNYGDGSTTYADTLGSQAGLGTCFAKFENPISIHCDEDSVIMGIFSVVPRPAYSQILNPSALFMEQLDQWTPEFDKLGLQPVDYRTAFPVQASAQKREGDVFGYNRPWWQYFANVDEVHGEYRGSAQNYIMNRTFSGLPELSQSFLQVDASQVNDVFKVREYTDKVFGQIYLDRVVKMGISSSAVARLE